MGVGSVWIRLVGRAPAYGALAIVGLGGCVSERGGAREGGNTSVDEPKPDVGFPEPHEDEFVGELSITWETASFRDCESGEIWGFIGLLPEQVPTCGCATTVRVRASVSECDGGCGHLSQYSKSIDVQQILGGCDSCQQEACGGCEQFPERECDVVAQDCPDGLACLPRERYEGAPTWEWTKCLPGSPNGTGMWEDCSDALCIAGNTCADFGSGEVCVPFCDPDGAACDMGSCVACSHEGTPLSLHVCWACDPAQDMGCDAPC